MVADHVASISENRAWQTLIGTQQIHFCLPPDSWVLGRHSAIPVAGCGLVTKFWPMILSGFQKVPWKELMRNWKVFFTLPDTWNSGWSPIVYVGAWCSLEHGTSGEMAKQKHRERPWSSRAWGPGGLPYLLDTGLGERKTPTLLSHCFWASVFNILRQFLTPHFGYACI